ncbi:hypothetical protein JX265_008985 [Neoarthrinium moseri]|uniref:Uncharacterized protein n=1 Tax=Neoarthrinium moseri TaxID=1658444 RepID=A0A9P9WH33_9PEZI|nr:uncharacterized protein JN550_007855 [Neoarthrinium moseri]KAI1846711.1 hypothetical protein JX266_007284 [Neoarthrinium moseri]KAI1862939.1 hypothetical protein JX265_008985 [Neoarthrinium moseri]KAI1866166.1 hypothetical protein JN550_007855 [Neoarthrinium moseri]
MHSKLMVTAVAAFASAAAASSASFKDRSVENLRSRSPATDVQFVQAVSIPPECVVCDGFGLACVAACLAGGPLDPLCDICAGASIELIEQCIACIEKN